MSGLNIAFLIVDELVQMSLESERKAELARREQEHLLAQEQKRKDDLRSALQSDLLRFRAQCDCLEFDVSGHAEGAAALTKALRRTAASVTSGTESMSESQLWEARRQLKECFAALASAHSAAQYACASKDAEKSSAKQLANAYDTVVDASFADVQPETSAGKAHSEADPAAPDDSNTCRINMEHAKASALSALNMYSQDPDLPVDLRNRLVQSARTLLGMQDPEYLKNYIALTARPLAEQARALLEEYERNREEFAVLNNRYQVLCELYSHPIESFDVSDASLQLLQERIALMDKEAAEDARNAYISESVDAVMQEMGYDVLGFREVTKKSGRHFRNELFDYGEGVAVNVTYAQNGQISMEIGALDSEDRLPDDEETGQLCATMEHFCEDYDIIQQKLLERGVILARPDRKPPSPAYAQVINTSEFDMLRETQDFQVKRTAKRPRQQAVQREEA